MPAIAVKHNIEVAHRLFETQGKCEQIHGHSMWVTMKLHGELDEHGMLAGIEFGALKKVFRRHLDEEYDHRLLLNVSDPWSRAIYQFTEPPVDELVHLDDIPQMFLPGLQATMGDPTTENIALWIKNRMVECLEYKAQANELQRIDVVVWETAVNMAEANEVF